MFPAVNTGHILGQIMALVSPEVPFSLSPTTVSAQASQAIMSGIINLTPPCTRHSEMLYPSLYDLTIP